MLRYKKDAWLVFALFAITYAYFFQDPGTNGNSRLDLTLAIVREHRLTIDSFHLAEGLRTSDKAIFNHHYYTDKAIGSSVIAAGFYYPLNKAARLLGQG